MAGFYFALGCFAVVTFGLVVVLGAILTDARRADQRQETGPPPAEVFSFEMERARRRRVRGDAA